MKSTLLAKVGVGPRGALLISHKIVMLVSLNKHCTIYSPIFCLMFLIGDIKPTVEK